VAGPDREFHAYRRLAGARRDTALAAPTATALADLITQAEQAAARNPSRHQGDQQMSETFPSPGRDPEQTEARMRALTEELSAAGLDAYLHCTRGVLDITAALDRPGGKDVCVTADEDGYLEVSWWSAPGATPTQVASVVGRVLAVITGPF